MSEVVATAQQGLAGKYKPYPQYKDSGVEWLGVIPTHWSLHALKRTVSGCSNGIWGDEPNGEDDLIVLRVADFDRNKLTVSEDKLTYRSISEKERKTRLLKKGDLLIEKSGGGEKTLVGCVVIFDKDYSAVTSNFVAKMSPRKTYCSNFLRYAFSHLYAGRVNYPSIKQTTGIQNLDSDSYLMEHFCFPDSSEQQTIAAFLDNETARIDRLIAQQQRLIELLKEKRQSVISHAVTKGLNPNAPMKDSGIEWLGQVPEHWIVKPLRHLGYCQNGINIGAEAFGSGYPFVSYGDAYKNRVLPETGSGLVQSTPEDRKRYSLLAGDVLFTRTSETIEEIGFASVCLKTIENASFAGFLIRFRPNSNDLDANYSKYYFSNQLLRAFFIKEMNLITRASLSQDLLKTMPVVLPPRTEQKAIAEVLDEKSKRFDRLQQLGEEQIKILQERRTALISAAVTGKIDLRGWTPPAEEAAA
ncbi:restriction endonuclease subunit S [Aeromonas sobria]|uniref:restriction endonuclease subunit S n=1 Tax=Aeromonas sobria TaxID=646 RepID=UPI001117F202|nr:restriction endonuclease subunit S [Aeromonas sobria]TNI78435.1 restriction endonuclease subunit S [Aeromonas sobria]HEA3126468.1 restriction endonuclease subunit S [Aeromonas veronii]